jgi:IMP dehydrogenase
MADTAASHGLESIEDISIVDYARHPLVETTEQLQ